MAVDVDVDAVVVAEVRKDEEIVDEAIIAKAIARTRAIADRTIATNKRRLSPTPSIARWPSAGPGIIPTIRR